MKQLANIVLIVTLCVGAQAAWSQDYYSYSGTPVTNPGEVFRDIEAQLGFVPEFFKLIPEHNLATKWELFQESFLRADGVLSAKDKELIAVAVAGMKACDYCIPLHHALARYHGASEAEIQESAQVASAIGDWSSFLYAIDYPVEQFKKEVNQILRNLP